MATDIDQADIFWLREHLELYRRALRDEQVVGKLVELKSLMLATHARRRKVIFVGNGGSAAIASHCAVDFTKTASVRCINFNEADLITCFSNDYGYERWVEKALEMYGDDGDSIVLISSSGRSPNMIRAAEHARSRGLSLVTFTGFDSDNPLRKLGDLSLWIDSRAYNVVETTHQVWLLAVCDLIIGETESSVSPVARTTGRSSS